MTGGVAQRYLAALTQDLRERARADSRLEPFAAELAGVDPSTIQRGSQARLEHPAMAGLEQAMAAAPGKGAFARAALEAAVDLDWSQVFDGGSIEPKLVEGMIAAQLAGSYGRFASQSMATGQFLLQSGVHYPLHTHAATEIYYCLSGSLSIQHGIDHPPFVLDPGQISLTPSSRVHALRTGEVPVLLIYVWIGDLTGANWWWSRQSDGGWLRTAWLRAFGEPWKPVRSEPVTGEIMAEAHHGLDVASA